MIKWSIQSIKRETAHIIWIQMALPTLQHHHHAKETIKPRWELTKSNNLGSCLTKELDRVAIELPFVVDIESRS